MTSLVMQVSFVDSTVVLILFIPAAIRLQLFNLMSLETFPPSLAFRNCYQQSLSQLRSKLNEVGNCMRLSKLKLISHSVSQRKNICHVLRQLTQCRSTIVHSGTQYFVAVVSSC